MAEELLAPHHGGSAAHVATPDGVAAASPSIGSRTTLRVEVPHASGFEAVHLRSVEDGEPVYRPARRVHRSRAVDLYEVELTQVSPVQSYRFQLDGPRGDAWLTGRGLVPHDVPDTWDFQLLASPPPPSWVADATLYQIFPDRFARSGASQDWPDWAEPAAWTDPIATDPPSSMYQLYGGDLAGIAERLDHLLHLGVDGVYLTPVFPSIQNHRYAASSFDEVDPFLGGDEGLAALSAALRDRGLRLLGDLTLNHSGSTHPWFLAAQADVASVEAGFYVFDEHPHRYQAWHGVPTLPKFDHRDPELRRRLYEGATSVAARYLAAPFHLDGWRIDAANMAGRQGAVDLSAQLRTRLLTTCRGVRHDAYVLAEHCHDATADLKADGWHGTMDYTGFTRPVWSWLGDPEREVRLLGPPAPVRSLPGTTVAHVMDLVRGQLPWRSVLHSMTLLGSHDTARWAHVAGDQARRHVGLTWLLTFVGVPSLFYGDEIGLGADGTIEKKGSRGAPDVVTRAPMPWDQPDRWDHATLELTRRLVAIRRSSPALRRGGLRWVHLDDDVIIYLRDHPQERVLIALTRSAAGEVVLDAEVLGLVTGAHAESLLGGQDLVAAAGTLRVPAVDGPSGRVWRLPASGFAPVPASP
ncbi:MAG: glycoside hydrolase family 13 protein [Nitriliruptor sp.]|nr:MAG: glycoside hydrolase family 13 protein [Nitriliruptor sp.]